MMPASDPSRPFPEVRTRPSFARSSTTTAVILFAAANLALNLGLRARGSETALSYTRAWLQFRGGDDSWRPMLKALHESAEPTPDWQRRDDADSIYQRVVFRDGVKFQYPLTALTLPVLVRSVLGDVNDAAVVNALNVLSWSAIPGLLLCSTWIFGQVVDDVAPQAADTRGRRFSLVASLVVCLAGLMFYPLVYGFALGQVQTILDALFGVAVFLLLRGGTAAAGVPIGLMTLVKPQYGLLLVWAGARRRWRLVMAGGSIVLAGAALAVYRFGIAENLAYFRLARHIAQHGEAFYENQSVNGLLNRILQPAPYLGSLVGRFPPYNVTVHAGTWAIGAVIVGLALFRPGADDRHSTVLDLAIMAVSLTLASPIAWDIITASCCRCLRSCSRGSRPTRNGAGGASNWAQRPSATSCSRPDSTVSAGSTRVRGTCCSPTWSSEPSSCSCSCIDGTVDRQPLRRQRADRSQRR